MNNRGEKGVRYKRLAVNPRLSIFEKQKKGRREKRERKHEPKTLGASGGWER